MSEHPKPVTITVSPELAAVVADALDTAARMTNQDRIEHLRRVAAASDRATRGVPQTGDADYLSRADTVADGIAAIEQVQSVARFMFEEIAGDALYCDPVGAARQWVEVNG